MTGRDASGKLGIGTNAALTTATGDLLIDEEILGTVHIAPGRAYPECGGVNSSSLHWDIVKDLRGTGDAAPRGSLRIDDAWLIRDGVVQPVLRAATVSSAP
jgi:aminopeptidase